jgi:hypothetical protein
MDLAGEDEDSLLDEDRAKRDMWCCVMVTAALICLIASASNVSCCTSPLGRVDRRPANTLRFRSPSLSIAGIVSFYLLYHGPMKMPNARPPRFLRDPTNPDHHEPPPNFPMHSQPSGDTPGLGGSWNELPTAHFPVLHEGFEAIGQLATPGGNLQHGALPPMNIPGAQ